MNAIKWNWLIIYDKMKMKMSSLGRTIQSRTNKFWKKINMKKKKKSLRVTIF